MVAAIVIFSLITSFITIMFVWSAKRSLTWMEMSLRSVRELSETKRKLAVTIVELEIERAKKAMVVHVPISSRMSVNDVLDDKTKGLIRLAVSNPEKREGENAAMIVCKRLKEKIDG